MDTHHKRQIIILAAFCLPLFILVFRFYTEMGQENIVHIPEVQHAKPTQATAVAEEEPEPVQEQPANNFLDERKRIKTLLNEAMHMTQEQYLEKQKSDPSFQAPTIEMRRARLSKRLGELNSMLDDDDAPETEPDNKP